jgi:hypothetical protein
VEDFPPVEAMPTPEEQAAALWWWRPEVDRKRQALVVGGAAVGVGLGAGVATGSVVPALIAAVVAGALAVPVAIGEQKVLRWSWAILRADGRLTWWDTRSTTGLIDAKAEPVVHVVLVRTTSKVGRRFNHSTHWVVGAGEAPRLRGETEAEPRVEDWAQVAGLRLPHDAEVARTSLIDALGRFTEVRQFDEPLQERIGPRGLKTVATVEGLPE